MNFSHSFPCSFSKLWPCLLVFLPFSGQPQTTPQGQGRDLTDLTLIWQQATFRFREFITYMDRGRKSGTDASCQGLFLHTEQGVMGTSSLGSPIWTAASKGMGCHYNLKKVRPKPSHFIRSNETLCLDNLLGRQKVGLKMPEVTRHQLPPLMPFWVNLKSSFQASEASCGSLLTCQGTVEKAFPCISFFF